LSGGSCSVTPPLSAARGERGGELVAGQGRVTVAAVGAAAAEVRRAGLPLR
jgi:hypothetical protein